MTVVALHRREAEWLALSDSPSRSEDSDASLSYIVKPAAPILGPLFEAYGQNFHWVPSDH